jgi:hypothetical protein
MAEIDQLARYTKAVILAIAPQSLEYSDRFAQYAKSHKRFAIDKKLIGLKRPYEKIDPTYSP